MRANRSASSSGTPVSPRAAKPVLPSAVQRLPVAPSAAILSAVDFFWSSGSLSYIPRMSSSGSVSRSSRESLSLSFPAIRASLSSGFAPSISLMSLLCSADIFVSCGAAASGRGCGSARSCVAGVGLPLTPRSDGSIPLDLIARKAVL